MLYRIPRFEGSKSSSWMENVYAEVTGSIKRLLIAVSAWVAESGITLAQEFVEEKSNEITPHPEIAEAFGSQRTSSHD